MREAALDDVADGFEQFGPLRHDQGRAAAPGDEHVEHRGVERQLERVRHPAAGADLVARDVVREVGSQVAVPDRHPLGPARGPRGEQHVRHVVGVETVRRQLRRRSDPPWTARSSSGRRTRRPARAPPCRRAARPPRRGRTRSGCARRDGRGRAAITTHAEPLCREVAGEGHQAAGGQQREPPGHATVLVDDLPRHVLRRLTQLPVGQRLAVDLQRGRVGQPVRGVGEPLVQSPVSHEHHPGPGHARIMVVGGGCGGAHQVQPLNAPPAGASAARQAQSSPVNPANR